MLSLRWPSRERLSKLIMPVVTAIALAVFYLWHLGNLTPGLSPAEATARASSRHFNLIWHNPINVPQRLLQYAVQAAGHHGAFWVRLPSVFLALLLLWAFYLLVKTWFGRLVGLLSTILLATTPWVALTARGAAPDVLLLAPIVLWLVYELLRRTKPKNLRSVWLLLVIVTALSLYIPSLIWLVLAGAIFSHRRLRLLPKELGQAYFLVTLLLGLVLILPLLIAIANEPHLAKTLVLWPAHWQTLLNTLKSIIWSGLALFWRMPYHIPTIIGRLPILNATQIVLIVFGLYVMWVKARTELYGLLALLAFAILGAGIDHNLMLLTLALPVLGILAAAGLRYLYIEWRSVFPVNPIPRALAILLMIVLVSLSVLLGGRYVLAAWPHTVATRQTYVIK